MPPRVNRYLEKVSNVFEVDEDDLKRAVDATFDQEGYAPGWLLDAGVTSKFS